MMQKFETKRPISPLLLNMQMLVDDFSEQAVEPIFYRLEHDKCKLQDVQFYYGQQDLQESCVYLADAETFQKYPIDNLDICLLSVGDPGSWYQDMSNPILVFDTAVEIPRLLNAIREIFRRYETFEINLHQALISGSLSDLCLAALKFFQNPLFVHDENLTVLCRPQHVQGMTDVDFDPETGTFMYKIGLINHFKSDQEYLKTMTLHRASLWVKHGPPYYTPYRVLYMNLFDDRGFYRGRICINEINSLFLPSHFTMLEYFSQFVLWVLTRSQRSSKKLTSFEVFLRRYLTGSPPSREVALRFISSRKWQEHDSYFCAKVQLTERDQVDYIQHYAVRALSILFPRSCVFSEEYCIWVVEDLSLEGIDLTESLQRLREFSSGGMFPIGVSDVFHDFFRIHSGFIQAGIALDYATGKNSPTCFSRLVNRFFMDCVARQSETEALCHEKLFELRAIDAERGTDYYKTLRVYLENERNMTETAQRLHVHRSTLQYRIDKISEMSGLSFSDPEFRLYLLNCFQLLDRIS